MLPEEIAWKLDTEGYVIDMDAGERKDYSIDWTEFLGVDALGGAAFAIPAGLSQIGATEIAGSVVKIVLEASGAAGTYACTHTLTFGAANLREILKFRVRVT